jgi:hypothetical protein
MNASAASVYARLLRVKRERDEQAVRDRRDAKFEVLGSKFRKSRISDLELFPVSPVPLFAQLLRGKSRRHYSPSY